MHPRALHKCIKSHMNTHARRSYLNQMALGNPMAMVVVVTASSWPLNLICPSQGSALLHKQISDHPSRHSWGRGAPSEPIGPAQGSLSLKLVAHGCPSILLQPCIRVSWRNPPRGTNFFPRTICLRLLHLRLLSLARRASTVLAAVTEAPLSLPNPHFLGPLALPLESYEILRRKDSFSSEDRGCFCSALCFL